MVPTIHFRIVTALISFSISSCFSTATQDSSDVDIIKNHRADYLRYKETSPPTAKKSGKYSKWCFIRPSCIATSQKETKIDSPLDFPLDETSSVVQLMDQVAPPFLDNSSDSPVAELPECPICMDRKVERFFTPCYFSLCSICDIEQIQKQLEWIDPSEEEDTREWPVQFPWGKRKCYYKCPVCKIFHYPTKPLEHHRVERGNENSGEGNLVGVATTMQPSAIFLSFRTNIVELLNGVPDLSIEDGFLMKIGRVQCEVMKLLCEITTADVARLENPAAFASQWYHKMRSQTERLHYILSYKTTPAEWKDLKVWAETLSKMNTELMAPLGYVIERFLHIWELYSVDLN